MQQKSLRQREGSRESPGEGERERSGRDPGRGNALCTVAKGFATTFTAWAWGTGPWESALCLVAGRAPLQKFTAGASHLGLLILSHLDEGRMGTIRTKRTPGSGKESLGPVNEGKELVSEWRVRDLPCDSGRTMAKRGKRQREEQCRPQRETMTTCSLAAQTRDAAAWGSPVRLLSRRRAELPLPVWHPPADCPVPSQLTRGPLLQRVC